MFSLIDGITNLPTSLLLLPWKSEKTENTSRIAARYPRSLANADIKQRELDDSRPACLPELQKTDNIDVVNIDNTPTCEMKRETLFDEAREMKLANCEQRTANTPHSRATCYTANSRLPNAASATLSKQMQLGMASFGSNKP
ncbi:hypothetical protein R1flu_024783 [Riccia fluitans]|uniref:Uncharacterized protein n=1 Tax=Riccia fluitans TaxID=41844 RepID=A0ABD1XYZ3_9MARC